ncbi:MAG: hypothetical protein H0T07_01335 [Actinobacteria bacterium]|nr:hypothetical protein [Actinomycetota bacterium]
MEFDEALARFGFHPREERGFGSGAQLHVAQPNRYLTYTVHVYRDGSAIFSWEFALGEYLVTKGIQVGSDETLNQFAYPREEIRGPQDGTWLTSAIERTEAMLADLRLDRPED